jgi:hypothetical protein
LIHAALDFGGLSVALDDGGVLLIDFDTFGAAEVFKSD